MPSRIYQVIARRLFLLIFVIIGATMITFVISHVFRDPVYAYINPTVIERISEEQIQAIRSEHGLDQPLPLQYIFYLRDLILLDWGITAVEGRPVLDALADKFPATLELTILAMFFALAIGIPVGILSAVKKDRPVDHVSRFLALSGVSMPVFWLGLLLQLFLGYYFRLLPMNQRVDTLVGRDFPITHITGLNLVDSILNVLTLNLNGIPYFISSVRHIIMPALALSWISMAIFARMMRTSMLETIQQDFITMARSKGLSERVVIYKHALRNAIIPTLTVAGLSFAGLLGGAVLTETVFTWPGIGSWAVAAINQSDANGILGVVVFAALIYVLMNLLVDILYTIVDPRISID